jgi:hypothetical protein
VVGDVEPPVEEFPVAKPVVTELVVLPVVPVVIIPVVPVDPLVVVEPVVLEVAIGQK